MSIQAVAWVLENSAARGISRLVLISLANHVNGQTGQCNPGYRRIAQEAGISASTVSAAVKELLELGELEVTKPGTSHASARYRLPWLSTGTPNFVRQANEVTESDGSTREVRADVRAKRARSPNESIRTFNQEHASQKNHDPRGDPDTARAWIREAHEELRRRRETQPAYGMADGCTDA